MKKIGILFLTLFFTLNLFAQQIPASAHFKIKSENSKGNSTNKSTDNFKDNSKGTSMLPIIGDALSAVRYLEDSLGVEVVRIEYDIIKDAKASYRTLYTGLSYGVVALGDYRIKKIKLDAYKKVNDKWSIFDSNQRDSYLAILTVKPTKTEEYAFDVSVAEFAEGYTAAHFAIIYYH